MKYVFHKKIEAKFLSANLLEYLVSVGIVCCLIGVSYCWIAGNDIVSMAVDIIGLVLLMYLKIRYRNSMTQAMGCFVLLYFCFLFTPVVWISSAGIQGNTPYGVFLFCCLIPIVLDGKLQKVMLTAYLGLIAVLLIEDFATGKFIGELSAFFYQKCFIFIGVLTVVVIMLLAIKNQMFATNQQIIEVALTDELTHAYNARYLKDKLLELDELYKKERKNYCIAMLDIDDFKIINDTYGHLYGDEAIRQLAACIKTILDDNTILCRYGGDEFVIIFLEADKKSACKTCEDVRSKIQLESIGDKQIHATISMGMCERSEINEEQDILSKIDEVLYESKRNGKNRVSYR